MPNFNLSGKKIVITGTEGFLGRWLKNTLIEEGATVLGSDITGKDILDISNQNNIKLYVEKYKKLNYKIDGLINNAALSFKGLEIKDEQFSKTMDVNIKGTANMITEFIPLMNDNSSVVNISSIFGSKVPDFSNYDGNIELFSNISYGASKAGIEQITRYYAKLYGDRVRVNAVAPGGIFQGHSEDFVKKYSRAIPMKRMAHVEEIVNVVLFLLSPFSSYINGQIISVDGGFGL